MAIISNELYEVKTDFAVPRRTEIVEWSGDMMDEDLIEQEEMVVTVTAGGYIKRTALTDFRAQKRGGKLTSATKSNGISITMPYWDDFESDNIGQYLENENSNIISPY